MDIEINEQPLVDIGDLIFIDDMIKGRVYQVVTLNLTVIVNEKEEHRTCGLFNMDTHEIGRTFRDKAELNQFIARHFGAIQIRKHEDYIWTLRKK